MRSYVICVKEMWHPILLANDLIMRHKIKGNFCVPVLLLSRIQNLQIFQAAFLLLNSQW